MLCRAALVRTDDSEEHSASIIKVTHIGGLGTVLTITSNRNAMSTRPKRRHIQEDGIPHSSHRENLKSYIALTG
jgi:hypothetical protein